MSECFSSDCPTQVHTLETSVCETLPATLRQHLTRHSTAEVDASRYVYSLLPGRNTEKRLANFDQCKTRSWFTRHDDTGEVKVVSSSCKLRWCPLCSNARKYHLAKQVKEWLESVKSPKFLTLTVKHSSIGLDAQIDHLYRSFRKLRQMKAYKKLFKGGVWFFQIKKSDTDGLWHPHLHCVIQSAYVDHSKLWKAWLLITGTSKVVDVRSVKDDDNVAEYVARYAARPSDLAGLEVADQLELVTALHGRRLVGTWGSARVISLSPSKPPDAGKWQNVGSWWLVAAMHEHDERARAIWKAFRLNKPLSIDDSLYEFERIWSDKHFESEIRKKPIFQKFFEFT